MGEGGGTAVLWAIRKGGLEVPEVPISKPNGPSGTACSAQPTGFRAKVLATMRVSWRCLCSMVTSSIKQLRHFSSLGPC
jgi:hypothetical protein